MQYVIYYTLLSLLYVFFQMVFLLSLPFLSVFLILFFLHEKVFPLVALRWVLSSMNGKDYPALHTLFTSTFILTFPAFFLFVCFLCYYGMQSTSVSNAVACFLPHLLLSTRVIYQLSQVRSGQVVDRRWTTRNVRSRQNSKFIL